MNSTSIKQKCDVVIKEQQNFCKNYSFGPNNVPKKIQPFVLSDSNKISGFDLNIIKDCFKENNRGFWKKIGDKDYVSSVSLLSSIKGNQQKHSYYLKTVRIWKDDPHGHYTEKEQLIVSKNTELQNAYTTKDSPAYRVRKAEKIRKWIEANQQSNNFCVPKKCLHWDEVSNQWYCVAEALCLQQGLSHERKIDLLNTKQVSGLAELCFEAEYTDHHEESIEFTLDNKIAIIDTEPLNRGVKKRQKQVNVWTRLKNLISNNGSTLRTIEGFLGAAKLKSFCTIRDNTNKITVKSSQLIKEIQRVEKRKFWATVAKTILKISTVTFFAIAACFALPSTVPIGLAVTLKLISLAVCTRIFAWSYSLNQTRKAYTLSINSEKETNVRNTVEKFADEFTKLSILDLVPETKEFLKD